MERAKWTERTFTFDFPAGWMYNVMERLSGTPARIISMTSGLTEAQLTMKPEGKWSIKQLIGHLCDLEDMHEGRIDDFIAGKETLRAADITNAKTHAADHQSKSADELIAYFTGKRTNFVSKLEELDDDVLLRTSLHPRLQIPMRPVDLAFFTSEHDDHHLADIRRILKAVR